MRERPPHPTDFPASCAGGHAAEETTHTFDDMDRPLGTVAPHAALGHFRLADIAQSASGTTVTVAQGARWAELQVGRIVDLARSADGAPVANGNGRRITAVSQANATVTFEDGRGAVTVSTADAIFTDDVVSQPYSLAARTTKFAYDEAGRLASVTAPKGVATTGTANDFTTEYKYDLLDRVISESRLTGDQQVAPRRTHYCYDLAGDLRWATGARAGLSEPPTGCGSGGAPPAFTTRFGYDAAHRIVMQTSPLGHTQQTAYDANGQVESATDAQGTKQTNVYNERGELVRSLQPFQQNGNGKVTRSLTTKLEYDPAGNLVREMSPRAWDAAGTREEGFPLYVTSYDYDVGDRLVRVKLPDDEATRQAWVHHRYDANGNVVWTSLPVDTADPALVLEAQKTQVEYFDPGWVKQVTEPVRTWVKFDYTPRGEQASRDPQGQANVESWHYFADGLLKQNTDPYGAINSFRYDENGNLTRTDDASGVRHDSQVPRRVLQEYNLFDELTATRQYRRLADGTVQHLRSDLQSFDAHGNPLTRTDDAGSANERFHNFVHDDDDRLAQDFDDGLPGCSDDQVLETAYLSTGWVSREAIRKRPATCEQSNWPTRQVTTYDYFRSGDLEKQEIFKGIETDPTNLVESHTLSYVSDQGVYVNGHRLKDVFKLVGPGGGACATTACTATYAYDARERLVSWANGLPAGPNQTSIAYTLDHDTAAVDTLAGNVTREQVTVNGQAQPLKEYAYSPAGQLQTLTVGGTLTERYFYKRGNLDCVTAPNWSNCNGDTLESYSWDALDRLELFTSTVGRGTKAQRVEYVYDAFDRPVRASETRGGQEQPATTLEYLGLTDAVSNETQGAVSKRYGYDANLSRTGMSIAGGPNAGSYTYGRNPHGDVSLLLQETGGAKAAYGYRPYGERDAGLFAGDDDSNPTNPYRFNDRRLDPGSGSIDMGARRFAPDTGRFLEQDFYREALDDLELSEDPLTQNRYGFAGGNPISFVETDGHEFDIGDIVRIRKSICGYMGRNLGDQFKRRMCKTASEVVQKAEAACAWVPAAGVACESEDAWAAFRRGDYFTVGLIFASHLPGGKAGELVGVAGRHAAPVFKSILDVGRKKGDVAVYRSVDPKTDRVSYVGITKDFRARGRKHMREKGIAIERIPGLSNLTRADARSVEQALIELYGLRKNYGSLMNKINSISRKNPAYGRRVARGFRLLYRAGYFGRNPRRSLRR
jgi:RHS repeat-associated protein